VVGFQAPCGDGIRDVEDLWLLPSYRVQSFQSHVESFRL
jgi:hypothetical protein